MQGFDGAQLAALVDRHGAGRDFKVWNTFDQFFYRDADLEPCEMLAEATVRADAEGGVHHFRPLNVKARRMRTHFWIARSGRVVECNAIADRKFFAAHFGRFADAATDRHHWRVEPHGFLDGGVHAARILAQPGAYRRLVGERENRPGHSVGGGGETAKHDV